MLDGTPTSGPCARCGASCEERSYCFGCGNFICDGCGGQDWISVDADGKHALEDHR